MDTELHDGKYLLNRKLYIIEEYFEFVFFER